ACTTGDALHRVSCPREVLEMSDGSTRSPFLDERTFAQSLSGLGLIDEYRLIVHPLFLAEGLLQNGQTRHDIETLERHRQAGICRSLCQSSQARNISSA